MYGGTRDDQASTIQTAKWTVPPGFYSIELFYRAIEPKTEELAYRKSPDCSSD